jgi:hypothetical protein
MEGNKKLMQILIGTLSEIDHCGDVDGNVILKWILGK